MKDIRRLSSVALAVALYMGAFGLSGCSSSNPAQPSSDVALTPLAETEDATLDEERIEKTWIIRDPATFEQVWNRLFARRTDRPIPPIDFATQMVVVASMGPQPTTGYAVRFTGARRADGGVLIEVTTFSPGPNCQVTEIVTHPVAFSRMRKTDLPVRFEFTRATRDCSRR